MLMHAYPQLCMHDGIVLPVYNKSNIVFFLFCDFVMNLQKYWLLIFIPFSHTLYVLMMKRCCSLAKQYFFACDRGGRGVGTALHSIFGSGRTLTEHKVVPDAIWKVWVCLKMENTQQFLLLQGMMINSDKPSFFAFSRGKWSINGQFSIANLPSRRVFDLTPATFWHWRHWNPSRTCDAAKVLHPVIDCNPRVVYEADTPGVFWSFLTCWHKNIWWWNDETKTVVSPSLFGFHCWNFVGCWGLGSSWPGTPDWHPFLCHRECTAASSCATPRTRAVMKGTKLSVLEQNQRAEIWALESWSLLAGHEIWANEHCKLK